MRSVLDVLDTWEYLGLALGIKVCELNVIKKENATLRDRMKAMLLVWLHHGGKYPTWKTLCEALRDELVERRDIAEKIEQQVVKEYSPDETRKRSFSNYWSLNKSPDDHEPESQGRARKYLRTE